MGDEVRHRRSSNDEARPASEEVALLLKPPESRSPHEVMRIERTVGGITFFEKLSPAVRHRCCMKLTHEFVPAGKVLFNIGDPPKYFYVILSGTAAVYIQDHRLSSSQAAKEAEGSPSGSRTSSKTNAAEEAKEGEEGLQRQCSFTSSAPDSPCSPTEQKKADEKKERKARRRAQVDGVEGGAPRAPSMRLRRKRTTDIFGFANAADDAPEQAEAILKRVGQRTGSPPAASSMARTLEPAVSLFAASSRSTRTRGFLKDSSGPGRSFAAKLVLPPSEQSLSGLANWRNDDVPVPLSARSAGPQTLRTGASFRSQHTRELLKVDTGLGKRAPLASTLPGGMGVRLMLTSPEGTPRAHAHKAGRANTFQRETSADTTNADGEEYPDGAEGKPKRSRSKKRLKAALGAVRLGHKAVSGHGQWMKPILKGVKCDKLPANLRQVATFQRGQAFGEAAMMSDQGRTAAVATLEDCHFAVLEREDFLSILSGDQVQGLEERCSYLRSVHLFSQMPDLKIEKIARGLHRRDMKKNEAIYEVGSEVVSVCFVCDGEFALRRAFDSLPQGGSLVGMKGAAAEQAAAEGGGADDHAAHNVTTPSGAVHRASIAHAASQPPSSDVSQRCTATLVTRPHIFGLAEFCTGQLTHLDTAVCQSATGTVYLIPARDLLPELDKEDQRRVAQGAVAQEHFVQQRMQMLRQLAITGSGAAGGRQDRQRGGSMDRRSDGRGVKVKAPYSARNAAYSPRVRLMAIAAAKGEAPGASGPGAEDLHSRSRMHSQSVEFPSLSGSRANESMQLGDMSTSQILPGTPRDQASLELGEVGFAGARQAAVVKIMEEQGDVPPWMDLLHMDLRVSPRKRGWRPPVP